MSKLKSETLKKCFALLREFIEEAGLQERKKGIASLALDQLRKITAGTDSQDSHQGGIAAVETILFCEERPRVP